MYVFGRYRLIRLGNPVWYRVQVKFKYTGQQKKNRDNSWREYKKFAKDKAKDRKHKNHYKKYLKFYCARYHRALEHNLLAKERYDDLHSRTYKYAEDPWSWD